jgi:hypothetical protein
MGVVMLRMARSDRAIVLAIEQPAMLMWARLSSNA